MTTDDPQPVTSSGRDAEVVRRGLRAGLLTWAVVGGLLLVAAVLVGGTGRLGLVAVMMGFVSGTLVTGGWLLLAGILDLAADRRLGRRRLAWTLGAVLAAFLSPVLIVGALGG